MKKKKYISVKLTKQELKEIQACVMDSLIRENCKVNKDELYVKRIKSLLNMLFYAER